MGAETWLHFLINIEANIANMINRDLGQVHIIVTTMDLINYSEVVFMVLIPQCIFKGLKYLAIGRFLLLISRLTKSFL